MPGGFGAAGGEGSGDSSFAKYKMPLFGLLVVVVLLALAYYFYNKKKSTFVGTTEPAVDTLVEKINTRQKQLIAGKVH